MKSVFQGGDRTPLLPGRVLGLVFEKPSLRTRVSFEAGMAQLGGRSIFLSGTDGRPGRRESVADFARVVSEYVDAVVLRVFSHATLEEFARPFAIPVINGLSDYSHPCQALGDLLTIREELRLPSRAARSSSSATATTSPVRWPWLRQAGRAFVLVGAGRLRLRRRRSCRPIGNRRRTAR